MARILVTGAAGQIGRELVPALRNRYGNPEVVAAGHVTPLPDSMKRSGPHTIVDVTVFDQIVNALRKYQVEAIFHMSTILSALAEKEPERAHGVNINGLYNVLEAVLLNGVDWSLSPVRLQHSVLKHPTTVLPTTPFRSPTHFTASERCSVNSWGTTTLRSWTWMSGAFAFRES